MKSKKNLMFSLALNVLVGSYGVVASPSTNNYDRPYSNIVKNIDTEKTNEGNYKLVEEILIKEIKN